MPQLGRVHEAGGRSAGQTDPAGGNWGRRRWLPQEDDSPARRGRPLVSAARKLSGRQRTDAANHEALECQFMLPA